MTRSARRVLTLRILELDMCEDCLPTLVYRVCSLGAQQCRSIGGSLEEV